MDGHHSVWSTELGLQVYSPENIFQGLICGKGQALTKGLSKVKTRERKASQQT